MATNRADGPSESVSDTHELGDLSDLDDGELRAFPGIGTHGVVVCRVAGQLHALEDNCSHADTPLSQGRLRGSVLVCPLHGSGFDVTDGSETGPPAWEGVPCYAVAEADDGASIDLTPLGDDGPAENFDVGGRFETR